MKDVNGKLKLVVSLADLHHDTHTSAKEVSSQLYLLYHVYNFIDWCCVDCNNGNFPLISTRQNISSFFMKFRFM